MIRHRSGKKEILDEDNIPFEDIRQNMKELDVINSYLGGHAITLKGFQALSKSKKQVSVCEIGCGGGDNLAAIISGSKINISVTGIDIKDECIQYAKTNNRLKQANFITNDYRAVQFKTKPDIIFSSLFCHHFTNEELVEQFAWMKANSNIGFFVNDLQRNAIAYQSIGLLTKFFSNSYLVKNDAPLSVLRGFCKNELLQICKQAGVQPVKLSWMWAFRYLLIYKHAA